MAQDCFRAHDTPFRGVLVSLTGDGVVIRDEDDEEPLSLECFSSARLFLPATVRVDGKALRTFRLTTCARLPASLAGGGARVRGTYDESRGVLLTLYVLDSWRR